MTPTRTEIVVVLFCILALIVINVAECRSRPAQPRSRSHHYDASYVPQGTLE